MAVMWKEEEKENEVKFKFPLGEPTLTGPEYLRCQLSISADVIHGWDANGDQLKLAVAANLLNESLPLLCKPETRVDAAKHRVELKEILDKIFHGLDEFNVPRGLQARFVDRAKSERVFPLTV